MATENMATENMATEKQVTIIDKDAYDALNTKLIKVKDELEQHNKEYEDFCSPPDMVRIIKYSKFVGNHCQIIPQHEYELIYQIYNGNLSPLYPQIIGLNAHIENIKKSIVDVTCEITKLAELRDKQPNFDVAVIRDYKMKIATLELEKETLINSIEKPEILIDFPNYSKYKNDGIIISKEYNRYVNKINPLKKLIILLETEIEKELWRYRYITYSHENGLEVDEENIFRVCNKHWYEKNIDLAVARNITKENIVTNIGLIHTNT
jgi:hypothetical protein